MHASPYNRSDAAVAVLLLTIAGATPAAAYLDPASGSMILQVLLGGIAGLALFFKLFWRKIQGWFGGRKKADAAPR